MRCVDRYVCFMIFVVITSVTGKNIEIVTKNQTDEKQLFKYDDEGKANV